MKRILIIALLGLSITSCENTPTEVKNPKEETTVELQQLASIDTITYKVVEKDDTVYVLSTTDNMVVKKVENQSGTPPTMLLAICIMLLVFWILLLISN
jgi:hypothetical protein